MKTIEELNELSAEFHEEVCKLVGNDAAFGFAINMNDGKLKNKIRINGIDCSSTDLRKLAKLLDKYSK